MNPDQALEIVRQLAEGIDPTSGEAFPHDSPYQRPHVIRALYAAERALARGTAGRERARTAPENAGKPWTDEEDAILACGFEGGASVQDLASRHGRSRTAIRLRLVKLAKLPPTGAGRG